MRSFLQIFSHLLKKPLSENLFFVQRKLCMVHNTLFMFFNNNLSELISWLHLLTKDCLTSNPANMYLFKVNNRNTRKKCEICSNLAIKTPDAVVLVFFLLTFNIFHTFF